MFTGTSVLQKCSASRGSRNVRAAAQSGSSTPVRHDPQPATDVVPIPFILSSIFPLKIQPYTHIKRG